MKSVMRVTSPSFVTYESISIQVMLLNLVTAFVMEIWPFQGAFHVMFLIFLKMPCGLSPWMLSLESQAYFVLV